MVSIIIPTLNEQDYLPRLLESIKRQGFKDYEIIVSDAGSKDNTLAIAQKYGCKIVKGGLPAIGRNNGAKVAVGSILFFLDADTVLPGLFLVKSLKEFKSSKLDIASFAFATHSKNKFFHLMLNFYNKMIVELESKLSYCAIGVLIKKELFDKLNGYREELKLSEDHDLARRAVAYGKFGIIRAVKIFISDRRFVKDGWMTTIIKYLLSEMHSILIGPIKSDIFKYKFGHYKEKNN
ncbi:MAG: glycosyltransferase [Candidatus Staskawiczbacteria bacterium]|nr:glycosyltransferase [Candidatus Staskawiczbacteria bacterium]